ncbi:ComEA family DNA-binding protein [Arthrobacter sp. H41]|uniref:ComEA family DNA-binding protein n=1 Tax=Arthrobacter sp. H41 TaxID=1312978 RepID=UPI0006765B1B|nr:ComEA family DNA-binding protein [Arthrobacter sp. H41]
MPSGQGPGRRRWAATRAAALVFLGVALTVGAALFIVRSSEPSSAATSVELGQDSAVDAEAPRSAGPGTAGIDQGSGQEKGGSPAGLPQAAPEGIPSATGTETLYVHVTGAVVQPGVVEVFPGSRIFTVLEKAGGALGEADLAGVNLAAVAQDGAQLHVPVLGEPPRPAGPPVEPGHPAPAGAVEGQQAPVIDLNTATLAELDSLPRVGPVLAQRILEWRTLNGRFAQPGDLDAVPGIGPALLEAILPLVTAT